MTSSQAGQDAAMALTSKEETVRGVDEGFYKLNSNQTCFYRVNYPPARLAQMGMDNEKLSTEDKIGLIADAGALAISGDATTASLLTFLSALSHETNNAYVKQNLRPNIPLITSHRVWSQMMASLSNIRSIFAENNAVADGLKKFTLKLVSQATESIGWDFKPEEDYLTGQLRALLISTAGSAGHTAYNLLPITFPKESADGFSGPSTGRRADSGDT